MGKTKPANAGHLIKFNCLHHILKFNSHCSPVANLFLLHKLQAARAKSW